MTQNWHVYGVSHITIPISSFGVEDDSAPRSNLRASIDSHLWLKKDQRSKGSSIRGVVNTRKNINMTSGSGVESSRKVISDRKGISIIRSRSIAIFISIVVHRPWGVCTMGVCVNSEINILHRHKERRVSTLPIPRRWAIVASCYRTFETFMSYCYWPLFAGRASLSKNHQLSAAVHPTFFSAESGNRSTFSTRCHQRFGINNVSPSCTMQVRACFDNFSIAASGKLFTFSKKTSKALRLRWSVNSCGEVFRRAVFVFRSSSWEREGGKSVTCFAMRPGEEEAWRWKRLT